MLQSGYIFPSCMLEDEISDDYDVLYKVSNSCVFFGHNTLIQNYPLMGDHFFMENFLLIMNIL